MVDYSADLAQEICSLIVEGKSLSSICKRDGMPNVRTVYAWLAKHDDFKALYAQSREDKADTLADESIDIADDATSDWTLRTLEDGSSQLVFNPNHTTRARLMFDARKWLSSKLKPKTYGDKTETTHVGDSTRPIHLNASGDAGL